MKMSFYVDPPARFSFHHTVKSHGWYDLAPFEYDEQQASLRHVFGTNAGPLSVTISDRGGRISVETDGDSVEQDVAANVRHILRIDDDLSAFYDLLAGDAGLDWVASSYAGRLLRSPTVWEDLVKTICTTNCSWGLTKNMVANLVSKLGESSPGGAPAFPTPAAMAAVPAEFYREQIRSGYRSPYFAELARLVASGDLDPESWLHWDGPTADLKKEMKRVKGVGNYAAENLLKLVGRYDGLALDSWLRSQFYKRHNGEAVCDDRTIERHYQKFAPYQGLAIWCDMTKRWFD
jgi:N-glycosylase/DNA lyase